MNGAILRKALARIDAKRQLANEEARNNLLKAYENLDFKDVYEELRSEEKEVAKREAYGEVVDYNRLSYLKDKQNHVLKTIGLKEEDIYPNYSCKKCGDTGYVKGEVCDCLKREITKELFEYSGFTKKLATFEQSKYNAPTVEFMKKWCNAKTDRKTVLIYGHTGTGKTFLTECIASKLMAKNKVVFFTTAFALNNAMLNYHISFDAQREEILKPYTTSEVLIIDDLLATGGTVVATIDLAKRLGAEVVGIGVVIELLGLKGRELLKGYTLESLLKY